MRGLTRTHSVCLRGQERARLLFEATTESTAHMYENSRSLAPDSVSRTIICAINEQMNLRCAFKVNQQAAIHFYPLYPIRVTKGTMFKGIIHTLAMPPVYGERTGLSPKATPQNVSPAALWCPGTV